MRGKNLNQFSQSVIQRGGSMMVKRSSRIKDHPKTKKVQDGLEMVDI